MNKTDFMEKFERNQYKKYYVDYEKEEIITVVKGHSFNILYPPDLLTHHEATCELKKYIDNKKQEKISNIIGICIAIFTFISGLGSIFLIFK